jgi:alkyldihydroxyacetonephosphate synthase
MRRWNGWGDEAVDLPLPANAQRFLTEKIGAGNRLPDAAFEEVVKAVPPSRLPDHPLVLKSAGERLRHARGQSLPDWIALRSGNLNAFPDGVAYPETSEDVQDLLTYAQTDGAAVIPYGGGTSVVGHITPEGTAKPVLTIDLKKMNRLVDLDKRSQVATFGAGARGPDIEAQLRAQGFTLGHFPQSFEFSTVGGWVATRSSGQQSLRYGRIEQLFTGARMVTPAGPYEIPPFPASAAGPDLRHVVLGSEGRLGILTEVLVRVTPLPERETFYVVFFPSWPRAVEAVRKAMQAKIFLSMLRLSSPLETETQLALAGHERLVGLYERVLAWRGSGPGKCMLVLVATGTKAQCRHARRLASRLLKGAAGFRTGCYLGRKWAESRFRTPYLRNTLWEKGYGVDTFETATDWPKVGPMMAAIESALQEALDKEGERIHAFSHLSHLYSQGASVYTTAIFRLGDDHEATLSRWQAMKSAASRAIVSAGGTISHQHGIGIDHAPYLSAEKGELGMEALKAALRVFDPEGMMNPGKLVR